jgi:hypothetical protein
LIDEFVSGRMDPLPHNGAVITLLAVTALTHRQSIARSSPSPSFFVIALYYLTGVVLIASIVTSNVTQHHGCTAFSQGRRSLRSVHTNSLNGLIMKTRLLLSLSMAGILTATSFGASAADVARIDPLRGVAAGPTARADQIIVVTDATQHVNVVGGTTVRFVIGDHAFNWTFDTGSAFVNAFDLAQIAPPDTLHHRVTVYVAGDPMYR